MSDKNTTKVGEKYDVMAELQKLREENARLKANRNHVSLKVSQKGGVSVYGLGRFPVTLYKSQWEALLGKADEITKFIADNADQMATKE